MYQKESFAMVNKKPLSKIKNKSAKAIFVSLCSFKNSKTGLCCPSIRKIAEDAKVSTRSVTRGLKYLVDNEVLKINRGTGSKNKYSFNACGKDKNVKFVTTDKISQQGVDNLATTIDNLASDIISINNNNNKNTSSLSLLPKPKTITINELPKTDDEEFFLFFSRILEDYNNILGFKLGTVRNIPNQSRIDSVKRCSRVLYNTEAWRKFFKQVANTSFLCGKGKNGFKADFDWLLEDNHFMKVFEGKYETNDEKVMVLQGELSEMVREKQAAGYEVCLEPLEY